MTLKTQNKHYSLEKRFVKLASLIILLFLNLLIYADYSKIMSKSKIFLDNTILEKIGFYHIDSLDFKILFLDKHLYILNYLDKKIARIDNGIPKRVYHASGQGPGEFIYPASLFQYDNKTIAVFDHGRSRVFLFDLDLNYKNEFKVESNIRKLIKIRTKVLAFGDFNNKFLAVLNSGFHKTETFGDIPSQLPFKRIFLQHLYMGYFIDDCKIISTSWLYLDKTCSVSIIDINSKELKLSLKWEHPSPPTQKTIDGKINYYGSYYAGMHGDYYLIQNALSKKLGEDRIMDTIIFNKLGALQFRGEFPYFAVTTFPGSRKIYFVDGEENIRILDIEGMVNE